MISDRLSHLQSEVQSYYKQLAGREKAKRLARFEDKELLQQQIDELKKELGSVEREYWLRWQAEIAGLTIPEADAERVASELVREVEILEIEPAVQSNAELMKVLQEIKAQLSKPGIPAAGKLKAAIPLLPGLISYEMELDTEGLLRRVFPTVCNFVDKLKK
jgi:DNA repair exonuclease SbcCD ATPase subunit